MNYAARTAQPSKLPLWRARVVIALLLLWFLALLARAVYLQGLNNDFLRQKGDARYSRVIEITAHRGMITDRNGEPLAVSTPVESVWASPADVEITEQQVKQLAKLLEINAAEIRKRLSEKDRDFVYLKRQVPPEQASQVAQLGVSGIFLQREYRRYYPAGEVMAQLLGFTGIDDNGQEGLELAYQSWLAGKAGSRRVIKDRPGHIVEDVESIRVPQQGRDLVLSIDRKLQYLAFRELKQGVLQHKAKAGAIVVLDARSGEVLALANFPAYNPNNRAKLGGDRTRNRAVTDTFEPGSTLKPFAVAAALEAGAFRPDSRIHTAPGYFSIGSATIHDTHPEPVLTVAQVIQKSSNVGVAKMALALSPATLWNMYNQVGFGAPPHAGFPGEASGKLRSYRGWRPIEHATMAYGHGISVSLLQLTRAYTVFANDGELKPLSFIKLKESPAGQPIVSNATAKAVRDMMELVVRPEGTAPRAQVVGYRVAGKTGTAHKLVAGAYADRYVSSFVGMAPASDPRLIVAVMIDEPNDGQYYGGAVAAPVFSTVMGGALRMLGATPDAPADNVIIPPADTPEIGESV